MLRTLSLLAAALVCGCAPAYIYAPQENATARIAGQPAARYPIPASSPHGSVEIASFGVSDVGPPDATSRALHVRMIVENNDAPTTWTVDTREQIAVIAGDGESRPAFANGDGNDLPVVTVGPGAKRVLDLFYPLPAGMQSARRIPEFDVKWKVNTDAGVVAERTSFARLRVDPEYAYYEPAPAWTVNWWYDPYYPTVTFVHPPVLVVRPPAPRVWIVGRPRWRF